MNSLLKTSALLAALFVSQGVLAAPAVLPELDPALARQVSDDIKTPDLKSLGALMGSNALAVDPGIRGLLEAALDRLASDPKLADAMIALAAGHAEQMTPPSVPVVCADMRHIVEALPPDAAGSALHATIVSAADTFARSPVVVAAGRPNLCEDAWLKSSEEAQLAQQPNFVPPTLRFDPNRQPIDPASAE